MADHTQRMMDDQRSRFTQGMQQQAQGWLDSQAEFLARFDQFTQEWVRRQQEGIEASRKLMHGYASARDITDMIRVNQEWWTGLCARTASEMMAIQSQFADLGRRARDDMDKLVTRTSDIGQSAAHSALRGGGGDDDTPRSRKHAS